MYTGISQCVWTWAVMSLVFGLRSISCCFGPNPGCWSGSNTVFPLNQMKKVKRTTQFPQPEGSARIARTFCLLIQHNKGAKTQAQVIITTLAPVWNNNDAQKHFSVLYLFPAPWHVCERGSIYHSESNNKFKKKHNYMRFYRIAHTFAGANTTSEYHLLLKHNVDFSQETVDSRKCSASHQQGLYKDTSVISGPHWQRKPFQTSLLINHLQANHLQRSREFHTKTPWYLFEQCWAGKKSLKKFFKLSFI